MRKEDLLGLRSPKEEEQLGGRGVVHAEGAFLRFIVSGTGPSILGLTTCHSWITKRFCSFGKLSRSRGTGLGI